MEKDLIADIFKEIESKFEINAFSCNGNHDTDIEIKCDISSDKELKNFIETYSKYTGETLKVKTRKKNTEKSIYSERAFYRCYHDTRYEKTRDVKSILEKKPTKRFRNTFCPFQLSVKILKRDSNEQPDPFRCTINIEHKHNHPVNSLHALSFKSISEETQNDIKMLFQSGMTASQAYAEFLSEFRRKCATDLEFHRKKADRSCCPRRFDFNVLYAKFCVEQFGGKNGPEMFKLLEEKIQLLKEEDEDLHIEYKIHDRKESSSLIIAILTPLMNRVHKKVSACIRMI